MVNNRLISPASGTYASNEGHPAKARRAKPPASRYIGPAQRMIPNSVQRFSGHAQTRVGLP
jgi:hypothetical protein